MNTKNIKKIKKKALQISINFIVMLIMAIVVFGLSMGVAKKFFSSADTMRQSLNEQTKREIQNLMLDGSLVAIPSKNLVAKSGEFITIGVGVLNGLGEDEEFSIDVKNSELNGQKCNKYLKILDPFPNKQKLGNNEQTIFEFGVDTKGAPVCTYVLNVKVYCNDNTQCNNYGKGEPNLYTGQTYKVYLKIK